LPLAAVLMVVTLYTLASIFVVMDSRALDLNAAWWGVPVDKLMESAGRAVAEQCRGYKKVAVFCGRGNNGGDGFVAARHLLESGAEAEVFALEGDRSPLNKANLEKLPQEAVWFIKDAQGIDLAAFDLILDALVGIGFKGEVREPMLSIIHKINEAPAPKISIDVPSAGMVEADMVVSLHNSKVPGSFVVDIGIPKEAELYCGPGDVVVAIPERSESSHKGDFGRLLVIGGSREYIGTPSLVAEAAMRSGVDLVTVCSPQYVADKMPFDPNLIVHPLMGKDYVSVADVKAALAIKHDAIVFGNGLGRKSGKAVEYLMKHAKAPMVVDADALSLADKKWVRENMILTPHEGEFKALFGGLDDRVEDAAAWAQKTGAVIVLKGTVDVVSSGMETRVNATGNPYMTVGGTGDVLAGIIGGLLAQNRDLMKSACAGTFLSGLAGDFAAEELGVSLVATDVIDHIPEAIKECTNMRLQA
jgi:ADP-dependent NAD(P)H-hydrate dehydratase / NAD(P)H-hydrate epimerase